MNSTGLQGLLSTGLCKWAPSWLLILISTSAAFGQGFGHGTAVAVLRTPDGLLAAVDSKEVYTEYRDGIPSTNDRLACKLTRIGPWFAIVSGLVTGTSGFDALRDAQSAWQPRDSFRDSTAHVRDLLSIRLAHLITTLSELNIADFSSVYLNRVILQIAVFGMDAGVPRVEVVEFQARRNAADRLMVSASSQVCPGDCTSDRFVYLLGAHEAMETFLRTNPAIVRQLDAKRIESLVGLEYKEHPEIVGGPVSLIAIDKTGKVSIREGACRLSVDAVGQTVLPVVVRPIGPFSAAAAGFAAIPVERRIPADSSIHSWTLADRIQADIEDKLAALAHIWCHERIFRYSRSGNSERTLNTVDADVEMIDGVEQYTSIHSGGKILHSISEMGGAWSSGEIVAILRTSRDIIQSELGAVAGITTEDAGQTELLTFRHTSPDGLWTIGIGPRIYPIAFEGVIHLSKTTGQVTRIQWRATNPTSHISGIEWTVHFGPAQVAGKASTAPVTSTYTVAYRGPNGRVDRNETFFSNFREYGSETTINYEPDALKEK